MDEGIKTKEQKVGVTFNNKELLIQAFTHRSYINENRHVKREHNERLEFLGDAVLELVSTIFLYNKYPNKHEGDLTAIRASLVNTITISGVARDLGFNDELLLSKGESRDEGRARQAILANTFEAVIGSIYVDQGYDVASEFINKHLLPLTDIIVKDSLWIDSKSLFQEKAQELYSHTPVYKTITEEGPDHDKEFTIAVYVGEEEVATGAGKSKQDAEQKAARAGIEKKGWI